VAKILATYRAVSSRHRRIGGGRPATEFQDPETLSLALAEEISGIKQQRVS
jgi:hypothetical protein